MSFHYSKSHTLWGRNGYVSFSLKSKNLHSFQVPGDHRVQPGKVPSPLGGGAVNGLPHPWTSWCTDSGETKGGHTAVSLSGCRVTGRPDQPGSAHQLLKAKLFPPCEARQFGSESQRRLVINSSSLLTSLGLQQPHLQTQIWPWSAKLGVAGGLCRCFSALWRLSALMATLSPSSSSFPSPGGCLGLLQLLAWIHSSFFSNYNEVSYRGLESLEEGRSFSQYTLTVRSWFQEWTWNAVFFSWWFQGETAQVF